MYVMSPSLPAPPPLRPAISTQAAELGVPVAIVRLGMVGAEHGSGVAAPADFVSLLLRAIALVRRVPPEADPGAVGARGAASAPFTNVAPVDYVASLIARIFLQTRAAAAALTCSSSSSSSSSFCAIARASFGSSSTTPQLLPLPPPPPSFVAQAFHIVHPQGNGHFSDLVAGVQRVLITNAQASSSCSSSSATSKNAAIAVDASYREWRQAVERFAAEAIAATHTQTNSKLLQKHVDARTLVLSSLLNFPSDKFPVFGARQFDMTNTLALLEHHEHGGATAASGDDCSAPPVDAAYFQRWAAFLLNESLLH